MKYLLPLLMLASAQAFAVPAFNGTTSGELKWNGSIDASCNLANFVDGTVMASSDQAVLSSLQSGGAPAKVDVFTNHNGFQTVLGDAILIGPSGQVNDASIKITASAAGTLLDGSAATPLSPNPQGIMAMPQGGNFLLEANAEATRNGGGSFDAGTYVVRVPVSCVKGVGTA